MLERSIEEILNNAMTSESGLVDRLAEHVRTEKEEKFDPKSLYLQRS